MTFFFEDIYTVAGCRQGGRWLSTIGRDAVDTCEIEKTTSALIPFDPALLSSFLFTSHLLF